MGERPADLFLDAGAWTTATYRVGRAFSALPLPLRTILRAVHRPLEWALRKITGTRLPLDAEIGGGLYLAHTGGIEIAPGARIGRDCSLSGGAIIEGQTYLGDRVHVGPGARIAGPVRIGNDAAVGADAIVRTDVPDGGGTAGGIAVRGRRMPEVSQSLRGMLRGALPKPAQLLVRPG